MIITITMIINENIQPAAIVLINVRRLFSLEVSEETKHEMITMFFSLYNDFTWHCNGTKIVCYHCNIIF